MRLQPSRLVMGWVGSEGGAPVLVQLHGSVATLWKMADAGSARSWVHDLSIHERTGARRAEDKLLQKPWRSVRILAEGRE